MIIIEIEPIIKFNDKGKIITYSDKEDKNYIGFKNLIERHQLQIGDNITEVVRRAISYIYPIRPEVQEEVQEEKEEIKIKPKGMFSL